MRDYGACASPFNSFMILQGIETLSLRMRKHCDNTLEIARFLKGSPNVDFVNYPALEDDKYYALAQKYLPLGCGGVFTFGLKGGRDTGARFIDSLRLFMNVANVGDVRSLVIHPATTTHSQLSDQQLAASGIAPATIRLSVGLEDVNDLISDLDQAMKNAEK
jgi:O-acetylhomoserine (thiol)-lyase